MASPSRLASQPSPGFRLQSPNPMLHALMPQAPPAHPGTPLAGAMQALPQAPQFITSTLMSISQPLPAMASQSRKLPLHIPMTHAPRAQAGTPLGGAGQAM